MAKQEPIQVSSHVSRDFLQNSAYFNTLPKLIWEYVSNSLDSTKEGIQAIVSVEITNHEVTIADNGRGMSRQELGNFFQMHGENIQRKRGKSVRGRFGTGKSAAFGLANYLCIDTTQSGIRNVVELHRKDIEAARNGETFPVRDLVTNEPTGNEDGTLVIIREFNLRHPDVDKVISYLERHLSRYRVRAFVTVNKHECKFREIPYAESFELHSPPDVTERIGNVRLVIKVSPVPLDEETNGVDILSNGIWHGITLAGLERKDRANYLFGEIDAPVLEEGEWPIPPFDNTRNNTLNPQNPAVVVLLGWLSEELESVRLSLVDKERTRRKSEEAKQLEQEAEKIAQILNEDFEQLEFELELARQAAKRSGGRKADEAIDQQGQLLPGGGDTPTPWEETGHAQGSGKHGRLAGEGDTARPGPTLRPGSELGARKSAIEGINKSRHAVFTIDYTNDTSDFSRSRYERQTKTIYINLDHPQIASSLRVGGGRITDPHFRQICYEVAAVEYALAIPNERLEQDEIYSAEDALYDIKEIISRVTRRLAQAIYD